jgi:hypothetical protein
VRYLEFVNPTLKLGSLRSIGRDEVAHKVTIPRWRKVAAAHSLVMEGLSLPDRIPRVEPTEAGMSEPEEMPLDPAQRNAVQIFGVGLALALIDRGWTLHVGPGDFHVHRGPHRLNPFLIVKELMTGRLSSQAWKERCAEMEIGEIGLNRASPEAPPRTPPPGTTPR